MRSQTKRNLAFIAIVYLCNWFMAGLTVLISSGNEITTLLCTVDDFDSQVRQLLKSEMLTQEEIRNLSTVFYDLQETLQILWPGSEVMPLGSFVTGLATKSSDADCMVKVPNQDVTSDRHLILQAANLLRQHPLLYHEVRPKVDAKRRMPLLKFKYVRTKRNCDVNFISNLGLQNSLMMRYYLNIENKFLTLAAILKLWSKVHRLRSTDTLASNSLNLLIIFYLQQLNMIPPFSLLQQHLMRCPVHNWETSFKIIHYNFTTTATLHQLLGGFFEYYSKFDFDNYIVSPLLGHPIAKKAFENVDSLPNELSLYKVYIKTLGSKPLRFNTKLCVQDAIEQRRNTADVSESKVNKLLSHIKLAKCIYDTVDKDLFLKVLLDYDFNKLYNHETFNKNSFSLITRLRHCAC